MKWLLLVTLWAAGYAYVSPVCAAEIEYETVTMSWKVPKGTPRKQWYEHTPFSVRGSCFAIAQAQAEPDHWAIVGDEIDTWEKCDKFLEFPIYQSYWKSNL